MNEAGVPDFNALQNAMDAARGEAIEYFVFDLPFCDGRDLRQVPLQSRRALLKGVLEKTASDRVRLSQTFDATPAQMLEAARQMHLEGIILKRPDAPYVSRRSETWLKLKCTLRQEFVICGFTDRANAAAEVGSLLLGTYEQGKLEYSGNVGTGWGAKVGRDLHAKLAALETDQPTLAVASIQPGRWSRRTAGAERWVEPRLVAEVSFREWTPEGHIRHAVFESLRNDKPAREVSRERAAAAARPSDAAGVAKTAGIKVTNPDRVIDASTGLTKLALFRYYDSIAERILPHLKDRPVSLVRAPEGIAGELFFQKHPETKMPGLRELDAALWPGHAALLGIDTREALLAAAQMNTVELHTWNSTTRHIDQPDRMIFDLDPGEGVGWAQVQEAAILTRTILTELGLECWLKTSGGKGLHVVVPLVPKLDYDVVKRFSQAIVQHLAQDDSAALRRQERRHQSGRQDLRRLPAQRPRPDDRRRVFGALAARPGRVDAGGLGAAVAAQERRAVDDPDRARVPQLRAGRPVGRLLDETTDARRGHEKVGLNAAPAAALAQRSA